MPDDVTDPADKRRQLESKISLIGLSIQRLQAQLTRCETRKHQLEGLGVTQLRGGTVELLQKLPQQIEKMRTLRAELEQELRGQSKLSVK